MAIRVALASAVVLATTGCTTLDAHRAACAVPKPDTAAAPLSPEEIEDCAQQNNEAERRRLERAIITGIAAGAAGAAAGVAASSAARQASAYRRPMMCNTMGTSMMCY